MGGVTVMLSKISMSALAFNVGFNSSSVPSVSLMARKEALTCESNRII
jgi:hypothetical protein